ncbi:MAG: gluconate 2-dehydrogenase subunit 3 family protein [Dehalococcoidaceae bacterium]|nr:gluconate 2-dehydrogenase subunit 3 family protein [Dehalococcoidaceae bacterium]
MRKENGRLITRRDFIKAGATVGGVAVLSACTGGTITTTVTQPPESLAPSIHDALQFFSPHQAATVNAIAGRIIPGTPEDPGAKEAGVVVFIDQALYGFDKHLQMDYFAGIKGIDNYAEAKYGAGFVELSESEQDDILTNMNQNTQQASQYLSNPGGFFATLRTHTRQGMFGDPIFGGNWEKAGWKLLGHPGIVFSRSIAEQACDVDFSKEYMGVKEYYQQHPT